VQPEDTVPDIDIWTPQSLEEFKGQDDLTLQLQDAVDAAQFRRTPLPPMIFDGPPGLGKTSLIHLLARVMGVRCFHTVGRGLNDDILTDLLCSLNTSGHDAVGFVVNREEVKPDLFVIDECEQISTGLSEILHQVVEPASDGRRLFPGKMPGKKSRQKMWAAEHTLILITNFLGEAQRKCPALVNRMQIHWTFQPYPTSAMVDIVMGFARRAKSEIDYKAAEIIAARSAGVPRNAKMLFARSQDRLDALRRRESRPGGPITPEIVSEALTLAGVDEKGLDRTQVKYLQILAEAPGGRPGPLFDCRPARNRRTVRKDQH
jgi:Holliday junction DNA helicase RuvB